MKRTVTKNSSIRLLVWCAVALSSACSPTKGYPGPDLPEERVSLVEYRSAASEISVDRGVANDIAFGSSGIALLPGTHRYELSIDITGEKGPCRAYATLDESGYHSCLKKQDYCDCHSYVTVHERCELEKRYGHCGGEMETQMGRKYLLVVDGHWGGASSAVTEEKAPPPRRQDRCELEQPRTEETDDYVGSGSSYIYRLESSYDDPCS